MADLTVTAAKVAPIFDKEFHRRPVILAETVTAGQVGYQASTGKYGLADANGAGKQQARGIFLQGGAAGQAVDLLMRGYLAGYTISQAYDAQIFLSDTAGALADAAGTMTVPVGRVVPMSDADLTKVLYVDFTQHEQWA